MSRRLDLALDISGIGVFESDLDDGTVEWDARLLTIYGIKDAAKAAISDAWTESLHPDDRDRVAATVAENIARESGFQQEFRIIRGDGAERVIKAKTAFFIDGNGHRKLIGANWDVTEEVMLNAELKRSKILAEARNIELEAAKRKHRAPRPARLPDGLPNRRYLDRKLEELSARSPAKPSGRSPCCISISTASSRSTTRSATAPVTRCSSMRRGPQRKRPPRRFRRPYRRRRIRHPVHDDITAKKISNLAERIIKELGKPIRYEHHDCRFGASVGIASDSGPTLDGKQLLLNADIALYRAKGGGATATNSSPPTRAARSSPASAWPTIF
jgi:PAS domain S-box-containing protein